MILNESLSCGVLFTSLPRIESRYYIAHNYRSKNGRFEGEEIFYFVDRKEMDHYDRLDREEQARLIKYIGKGIFNYK